MKECILIVNHDTGEYRLEKLNSNIAVKKTRWVENKKQNSAHQKETTIECPDALGLFVLCMYVIYMEINMHWFQL